MWVTLVLPGDAAKFGLGTSFALATLWRHVASNSGTRRITAVSVMSEGGSEW
jgi:hypothetical protein